MALQSAVTRSALSTGSRAPDDTVVNQTGSRRGADFSVVYVIDRLNTDLGGTEGQVVKLLNELSKRIRIELVVLNDCEWLRDFRAKTHLKVTLISCEGGIRNLQFWRGLRELTDHFKTVRPDVVHTFFPIANIVGPLAARAAGVRCTIGSRRDYGYWMTPAYLAFTRMSNRFVDGIVTNSPEVKRFTVEKERYPESRIRVIYNGTDVSGLVVPRDEALKASLGIPAGDAVVSLVANFKPIKLQETLVKALKVVHASRPDVSVLFIGATDNDYVDRVRKVVAEEGQGGKVFYAHAKGDVGRYLSFTDVGCNCSESEGLSNAVIEYMAAGVPCVVSDGGGNKDLVQHGVNGLLYPVGQHEELAACILRILNGADDERARFVQTNQDMVRREMTLDAIIDQYEAYYRAQYQALAAGGRGGA